MWKQQPRTSTSSQRRENYAYYDHRGGDGRGKWKKGTGVFSRKGARPKGPALVLAAINLFVQLGNSKSAPSWWLDVGFSHGTGDSLGSNRGCHSGRKLTRGLGSTARTARKSGKSWAGGGLWIQQKGQVQGLHISWNRMPGHVLRHKKRD